ncbi:MAG: hypothetical protein GTO12_21495 [Proteobacteria bacterium]|nr:hypothetical protein [Pseudomonadota bacterium]
MPEKEIELLTKSSGEAEQPFRYAVGKWGSQFLIELRDHKRLLGIRCPKCQRVYIPPRQVCGPCFQRMEELVTLSDRGTLMAFTIIRFSFIDPETGITRPVPYGYGFIKLDGSDSSFQHFINIEDESKVKIGARVQAVFVEKRKGNMLDIQYFKVIDE